MYEKKFLVGLFITLIIETLVVFLFLKKIFFIKKIKFSQLIFISFLASALTLPYLWFIFPVFLKYSLLNLLLEETVVTIIEAFIYQIFFNLSFKRSFFISLVANLLSFVFGLIAF